jgi:hypothetical protein
MSGFLKACDLISAKQLTYGGALHLFVGIAVLTQLREGSTEYGTEKMVSEELLQLQRKQEELTEDIKTLKESFKKLEKEK